MDRPLLTIRWGRNVYWRDRILIVILAPFPPEEQPPGDLCRALMNLEVRFTRRAPFVIFDAYFADRMEWPR